MFSTLALPPSLPPSPHISSSTYLTLLPPSPLSTASPSTPSHLLSSRSFLSSPAAARNAHGVTGQMSVTHGVTGQMPVTTPGAMTSDSLLSAPSGPPPPPVASIEPIFTQQNTAPKQPPRSLPTLQPSQQPPRDTKSDSGVSMLGARLSELLGSLVNRSTLFYSKAYVKSPGLPHSHVLPPSHAPLPSVIPSSYLRPCGQLTAARRTTAPDGPQR